MQPGIAGHSTTNVPSSSRTIVIVKVIGEPGTFYWDYRDPGEYVRLPWLFRLNGWDPVHRFAALQAQGT